MAGGGWKGLQWSWECGKPSLVWSNHSCLSIILPPLLPPSDLSQTVTPHTCLSPPFHYSHLTGQRIRVTPWWTSFLSEYIPSFYLSPITPSSLAGIWRVTLGQFNLVPTSYCSLTQCRSLPPVDIPPSSTLSLCFPRFTPPLPSFATQNCQFPHLSLLLSIHLSFLRRTFDIWGRCVSGRVVQVGLVML